jgi:hypothetical protein
MMRDLTQSRVIVKATIEKNYAVRYILDCYMCKLFNAEHSESGSVASWGHRIDGSQTYLGEAASRIRKPKEILGSTGQ